MPHCHCGGHGFDSRTYRIYCTFGRVDRLQTFNLCKKLRQGFESLRVHDEIDEGELRVAYGHTMWLLLKMV